MTQLPRPLRHGAVTTGALLALLVVLAALSLGTVLAGNAALAPLTARAQAQVTAVADGSATVTFTVDGQPETATLPVETTPGDTVTVAYDPADPTRAVLPQAPALVAADRAGTHLAVLALLALVVVVVGAQRTLSRARLRRMPPQVLTVRRVRQQHRLLSRSWIELVGTEPTPRFPVYFDPALVTLDTPSRLPVHGDGALRAVRVDGRWVYPSGRVRTAEPRGRLLDNPARPGPDAAERAELAAPVRRSLVLDAVLVAPAPFVGLFWLVLDGGGAGVWVAATSVTALTALWAASVLGSDPS